MNIIKIKQKRVNKVKLPENFEISEIKIGVPLKTNEGNVVGLSKVGNSVIPSQKFGPTARKNADGFYVSDKRKPKEYRYITTIWTKPFGNENASEIAVDIFKYCYPRLEIEPTEIDLILSSDGDGNKYILANSKLINSLDMVKTAINLILEIYGVCYIYKDELKVLNEIETQKCHWEILKDGEKPSINILRNGKENNIKVTEYDVKRLEVLESYESIKVIEGIAGFQGYYAFLFKDYCIFESAKYGNATYITKSEDWKKLSQLTKRELFDLDAVENRLVHNKSWENRLEDELKRKNIHKRVI